MIELSSIVWALCGGAMIGASAAILLWVQGRIAGMSFIAAGAFVERVSDGAWRRAFVVGLVLAGVVASYWSPASVDVSAGSKGGWAVLAGVVVGFGSRLGSGCTSGHGVCGISRFSKRSVVATCVFMAVAMLTRWLLRAWGGV